MHTSILDLHDLLNTQSKPQIIALTKTKHQHIKSIWRHTLENYKLVYNLSLYNKKTKRTSGDVILAIHSDSYVNIQPVTVPYQPYLTIGLLQFKVGTKLMDIAAYLPQPSTSQGKLYYQALLQWLAKLLNDEHPHYPIILGGDLHVITLHNHRLHYPTLK